MTQTVYFDWICKYASTLSINAGKIFICIAWSTQGMHEKYILAYIINESKVLYTTEITWFNKTILTLLLTPFKQTLVDYLFYNRYSQGSNFFKKCDFSEFRSQMAEIQFLKKLD